MSYYRLYPKKQNTAFRSLNGYSSSPTFATLDNDSTIPTNLKWSVNTNTGANPTMELHDGKSESVLLFSFEIPAWLQTKINAYQGTFKLKLFDAGTLFEPAIKLKQLKLDYFTDDFVEGDGYSFLAPNSKLDVSNFIKRDSVNAWKDTTFTNVTTYQLNSINEDLEFDVTDSILNSSESNLLANFSLTVNNRENNLDKIFTKFFYSNYTRTVFKPFLEFIIPDEITDNYQALLGNTTKRIFLLNQNYIAFSSTLTASVTLPDGSTITPTVSYLTNGLYYIDIAVPAYTKATDVIIIVWKVGGVDKHKEIIKIQDQDLIVPNEIADPKNLVFYPITPYVNNIVTQGDIIPFEVISEIRGQGTVCSNNYEFKVIGTDGFEMVPWTKVSSYRNKMFFSVNTDYFYPEQQYEVYIRNNNGQFIMTGINTYKFKIQSSTISRLRNLNASPYNNRDYFFSK